VNQAIAGGKLTSRFSLVYHEQISETGSAEGMGEDSGAVGNSVVGCGNPCGICEAARWGAGLCVESDRGGGGHLNDRSPTASAWNDFKILLDKLLDDTWGQELPSLLL
jgi:hypothetical protein